MQSSKFPEKFLWGSATAAYQVEGGINNNDWAESSRRGILPDAGMATDHYHRYEEDFDIAKSLGQNAHRLSIEWSRIEPQEGVFNQEEINHYRKVLRALHARDLEPFVTLWHFTLPSWFANKGGFENKEAPEIFARYCTFVFQNLKEESKFWITINEPLIWLSGGYLKGKWPPFKKNTFLFLKVFNNLIKSHRLAYKGIKLLDNTAQVGIAKHNMFFDSDLFPWNQILSNLARWFWNHLFLRRISNSQDFIGLNYYIHKRFGHGPKYEKTEMGWDIFPEGFRSVLLELKQYNKPIYVTENGIADEFDQSRKMFIREHIRALKLAIDEKVDVRGYFYWSLLDNFEWSFGFEKRFGLVEIDYKNLKRNIRPSALFYKEIAEKNSV